MSAKTVSIAAAAALCLGFALPAGAAVDAAAAQSLAKESGCMKCHAIDKAKKGPAYQKVAAKYKGKGDAEAKLVDFMSKGAKVKMDDGSEEEHKVIGTKDAARVRNLAQWILAQ